MTFLFPQRRSNIFYFVKMKMKAHDEEVVSQSLSRKVWCFSYVVQRRENVERRAILSHPLADESQS